MWLMLNFPSNPTFLGLNNSIKPQILSEFDIAREALNINYEEVYKMSVYKRKYFLSEKLKQYEKAQAKKSQKSGRQKK